MGRAGAVTMAGCSYSFAGSVGSDSSGYGQLAAAANVGRLVAETVDLDFSRTSFFDANLAAPLGVVVHHLLRAGPAAISGLSGAVRAILDKNGFTAKVLGAPRRIDTHGTTIRYERFGLAEYPAFVQYFRHTVSSHGGLATVPLPNMREIEAAILEIFLNAAIHSDSEPGIFVCGQFFPHKNRLDFTIADSGIGFAGSLAKRYNQMFPDEEAVRLVIVQGYTSKIAITGGTGLRQVHEYLVATGGRLQIVSGESMWQLSRRPGWTPARLGSRFPGTIVNIEFNTLTPPRPPAPVGSFREMF